MAKLMEHPLIQVQVVTPYGMFIDESCELLVLPTSDGEQGVMYGHVPFIAAVYPGELRLITGNKTKKAFVSNGYTEVRHELVTVVCNAAEWASEIDIDRSKVARDRALERLADPTLPDYLVKRNSHALRRAKARLKIAGTTGTDSTTGGGSSSGNTGVSAL